jgi:hypothetical protein
VCLPASENDNRSCRYDGEIVKLGDFNYLTGESSCIWRAKVYAS